MQRVFKKPKDKENTVKEKKVSEKFGGYKKKQYLCTAFKKRDASFNPQCTGV